LAAQARRGSAFGRWKRINKDLSVTYSTNVASDPIKSGAGVSSFPIACFFIAQYEQASTRRLTAATTIPI